ncbi:MAG: hypothetical protein MUC60_08670 [Oscillatoria sp. Prado101]|nr:hypothetical protein [Oscillatoria sp. Prado101]
MMKGEGKRQKSCGDGTCGVCTSDARAPVPFLLAAVSGGSPQAGVGAAGT